MSAHLLILGLYFTGIGVHTYLQGEASVRSASNGLQTISDWLKLNHHVINARLFLSLLMFILWRESPDVFNGIVGKSFPMTMPSAGIAGFFIDSFWDKVLFVLGYRVEVPKVAPPQSSPDSAAGNFK